MQAVAAAAGLFLGLMLAVVFMGIVGMVILWFYGSFWTTGLVMFLGGDRFLELSVYYSLECF